MGIGKQNKNLSKSKTWQGTDIENALAEIRQGNSIRGSAKKYGMAESTLRNRISLPREGKEMMGSGRRTVLTQELKIISLQVHRYVMHFRLQPISRRNKKSSWRLRMDK